MLRENHVVCLSFLSHRCLYPDVFIQVKIGIKGNLKMELGPNLAIFNLRIMCGMKRVIVFALKNNYELIVWKKKVTAYSNMSSFLSPVCAAHTG